MNEADDADWSDDSDDIAEVLGPDNVIDLTYSLDEEDRVFEEGIVINRSGPQDGAFRKLSEDTPNSSPAFSDKSDGDKYSCTPIDFRYGRQMNERPSFFIYIWSSNDYVYEDQLEAAGDRHVSFLATDYLAMYWRISVDGSPSLRVETKDRIDCIDICSKSNCGAFNLVDMLRYFTEAEVLTDDNSWHCNRCCKRQASTKTLSFWKLPPLLIVQIKRFSYISYEDSPCYAKQKIEVPVRYPLKDFDMKPFLSPGAPDQSTKYDLYAVVSHVGSCFFGHYVARARLLAKCGSGSEVGWRYFNDDDVCDQPHMNDEDPDAYFLFYARQNYCVDELLKSYKDQCVEMDGSDSDTDFGNEANPVIVDDIPGSSC